MSGHGHSSGGSKWGKPVSFPATVLVLLILVLLILAP